MLADSVKDVKNKMLRLKNVPISSKKLSTARKKALMKAAAGEKPKVEVPLFGEDNWVHKNLKNTKFENNYRKLDN